MVRELVLLRESSNIIEVQKLKNVESGLYLDGAATVTVTLTDETGAEVAGATWPLALAYVAASQGTFRTAMPPALDLVAGAWYEALIEATSGSLISKRRYPIRAVDS